MFSGHHASSQQEKLFYIDCNPLIKGTSLLSLQKKLFYIDYNPLIKGTSLLRLQSKITLHTLGTDLKNKIKKNWSKVTNVQLKVLLFLCHFPSCQCLLLFLFFVCAHFLHFNLMPSMCSLTSWVEHLKPSILHTDHRRNRKFGWYTVIYNIYGH